MKIVSLAEVSTSSAILAFHAIGKLVPTGTPGLAS